MKKLLLSAFVICLAGTSIAQESPLWMRHCALSPDGTTIAFTYKGDIYTVPSTGGRATQITTNPAFDTEPVWSPDSKQIAFASDRMGMKHLVRFGLYKVMGSINVQLAEKTGFSEEDAQVIKECLRTLFVNDASSSRPEGSMEVIKLFWFEHDCKNGQYSSAKVHRSVTATLRPSVEVPTKVEDYEISVEPLVGLALEELEGM